MIFVEFQRQLQALDRPGKIPDTGFIQPVIIIVIGNAQKLLISRNICPAVRAEILFLSDLLHNYNTAYICSFTLSSRRHRSFLFLLFDHVYQNIRKVCHIVVYNHILRLIDFKAGMELFNSSSKLIMRILPLICSYPHGFNTIIIRRGTQKNQSNFSGNSGKHFAFSCFPSETTDMLQSARFTGMQRCMNKNRAALLLLQNRPALSY